MDEAILTGSTESHLATLPNSPIRVHRDMAASFLGLQKKAHKAGFQLEIVSGFRSFESQLRIWNQKALGERPLLDSHGRPLSVADLSPQQRVKAILYWSTLPGASRHHWGTDIDVIDRGSVPSGYQVQLTPEETTPGGIFGPLHEWLDRHMDEAGFFRPYQNDLGGIKPERWHLSHAPTAGPLFKAHSESILRERLEKSNLELKQEVLAALPEIFETYFRRVAHGP